MQGFNFAWHAQTPVLFDERGANVAPRDAGPCASPSEPVEQRIPDVQRFGVGRFDPRRDHWIEDADIPARTANYQTVPFDAVEQGAKGINSAIHVRKGRQLQAT